ncbi:MAG: hypothetical protein E7633_02930 [Ruminococcaceae bacterium]|nr:hypothetical protein [Oscillospiraceae bacterium]
MGNGNMLVYLKNTDILSFHAGEYTTPSFLTLECDFYSEEFSCRSARKRDTSTYVHRLYEYGGVNKVRKFTKSIEDARIVDVMHPSSQTFVRYCENIIPFTFELKIPPYVSRGLFERYKIGAKYYQTLSLVMPAGVSFYKNEVTCSENRMMIALSGDVRFISDGDKIELLPGQSRIVFTAGDGKSCVDNLLFALGDNSYFEENSKIVSESESFWKSEIARSNIADRHSDRELLIDALIALVSSQSADGGVISCFGENVIRADCVNDIVTAFLKLGLCDRAKKTLEFFVGKFKLCGKFYQIYGTSPYQYERYFSNSALGASELVRAFVNYSENTGDIEFFKENFAMLKKAVYALISEIALGMMPFSGCEREISEEILTLGAEYHGSLESTLSAYISFVKFTDFCRERSIKIQNDNGNILRKADELVQSIKKYFVMGNKVTLNVPLREKNIKKKRFAYGECDMCRRSISHIYYGELELAGNGVYMCPKCLSENRYSERFSTACTYMPQASVVLCAEPRIFDVIPEKNIKKILESAIAERQNDVFVRTVRSDMLFLEAVKYFDLKEYEILFKDFIRTDLDSSVYPHTVCGSRTKGKFDTQTMACLISAFI